VNYFRRLIEGSLLNAADHFPVLLLTGPRQSGKSTTLQKLFPSHRYISFDDPVVRAQANKDPDLFLADHAPPIILDEIQYVPEILPMLKMEVDKSRSLRGAYILTGSQAFPLMGGVSESLAGRVAIFELLPFSYQELPVVADMDEDRTFEDIIRGFFPGPAAQSVPTAIFHGSYIQTYLERDLRSIHAVGDLRAFQQFIEVLAANIGQIVNLSNIGSACGVTHPTVRKWLSVLEASRIIYLLRPYTRNLRKRVIRSPKLYFTDTGMVAHILRESNPRALRHGVMGGAIFENMIIMDLLKTNSGLGSPWQFFYYRDNNRVEVDLILTRGSEFVPIEIKLTRSPTESMTSGLCSIGRWLKAKQAFLLNTRQDPLTMSGAVHAMHWHDFVRKWPN